MDIRDRVMGDQPQDFLHQIAGIVPGYDGYVDRERRRDADKILRMQLARRYTEQRERLTHVQQDLLRGHHLDLIAEVDREVGALQRFIDRLSTATYGYAGLFDPIKIEAADLDQLYAFDMSLASGVDQVSAAIDAVEASVVSSGEAHHQELPAAVSRLSGVLDDLNRRLSERADLLSSGRRLPDDQYSAMLDTLGSPGSPASASPQGSSALGSVGGTPARYMASGTGGTGGAGSMGGSEQGSGGTPTTDLNRTGTQTGDPALETLADDNQSFTETPAGTVMGGDRAAGEPPTGAGIETGSSPANHPGAPASDLVEGLEMSGGAGASTPQVGMPSESPSPQMDVPDSFKP